MMDEYKDKRYIKEIIKEYNILLESWGSSESWDLNQFKTLENMIFETTKIDVNANTLKRFFQHSNIVFFLIQSYQSPFRRHFNAGGIAN